MTAIADIPAWWHGGQGGVENSNWGDIITPAIIEAFSGQSARRHRGPNKHLVVGSILHEMKPGDTIWGAGTLSPLFLPAKLPEGVTFRAVRGPRTRDALLTAGAAEVPEVYGDPALLAPYLLRMAPVKPAFRLGVIPHVCDASRFAVNDPAIKVIDICGGLEAVVRDIHDCEAILASSLHGIIAAEAYGKPTAWLRIDKGSRLYGGDFKFDDYYRSTDRDLPAPVEMSGEDTALPPIRWPDRGRIDLEPLFRNCPFNLLGHRVLNDLPCRMIDA